MYDRVMRGRVRVIAGATIAACGFSPHAAMDGGRDTNIPDAGTCEAPTAECIDDFTLRTCVMVGGTAQDTPCPWGCLGPNAHCGQLVPNGGGAVPNDMLVDPALHDITELKGTVDGGDGSITLLRGSSASGAVDGGIAYYVRNNIAVFRMRSIHVTGALTVQGPYPVVFVATDTILISGAIDAGCSSGTKPGPGGFPGASAGADAIGSGGGSGGGNGSAVGGGGGGYGGAGGSGGLAMGSPSAVADGGKVFGDPQLAILVGGGGGGGGGHGGQPTGGGGGGAIQFVAGGLLEVSPGGSISAGGCGGTNGASGDAGAGGGAGGAILLEALSLAINGKLAVNGGGGGAGGNGTDGQDASVTRQRALGGNGGNANGGAGGAGSAYDGAIGSAGSNRGGGGGGGVGRMRFATRTGSATVDNTQLSPALDDPNSPATLGSAHVE